MYQSLTLIGNLGSEVELRYTGDGIPVAHFSVAVNRKWNNNDGSKGEEVTWFRVTAWRRMAEVCNEYLSKGKQVMVVGRLKPNEHGSPRIWTTQAGEPRASFEVTASTVKFLGGRSDAPSAPKPVRVAQEEEYDEIPF